VLQSEKWKSAYVYNQSILIHWRWKIHILISISFSLTPGWYWLIATKVSKKRNAFPFRFFYGKKMLNLHHCRNIFSVIYYRSFRKKSEFDNIHTTMNLNMTFQPVLTFIHFFLMFCFILKHKAAVNLIQITSRYIDKSIHASTICE
jgi:hypothetical protein